MTNIILNKYGFIISDQQTGQEIYKEIKQDIEKNGQSTIDFKKIKSMATYNAKQIFGKLYLELGGDEFFNKIIILNASEDLKLIISLGIQSALESNN